MAIYHIYITDEYKNLGASITLDTELFKLDEHNLGTVVKAAIASLENYEIDN